MQSFFSSALFVEFSTLLILALTAALAALMTKRFISSKYQPYLFWSSGLWLFAFAVLLETIFAAGIYSKSLFVAYFTLVAVLVEILAIGSIKLTKMRKFQIA
ncbi:MAG: hypothetical protein QXN59_03300, partial [Candidatus Micrarchaeaceae archaeon]